MVTAAIRFSLVERRRREFHASENQLFLSFLFVVCLVIELVNSDLKHLVRLLWSCQSKNAFDLALGFLRILFDVVKKIGGSRIKAALFYLERKCRSDVVSKSQFKVHHQIEFSIKRTTNLFLWSSSGSSVSRAEFRKGYFAELAWFFLQILLNFCLKIC